MNSKASQARQAEDLCRSRYGSLVRIARNYAPTPELVYDIVQQACLAYLEKARDGTLDAAGNPLAYLYAITRNTARQSWNRYRRESSEVMQQIAIELMTLRPEEDATLPENDELPLLNQCIELLPEKSRSLIRGFYWDGDGTKKIALDEGVSQAAICQALYRIRLQLKKCIEWKNRNRGAKS